MARVPRGCSVLTCQNSVLSAFEESSAACISDMLRQVSNGQYLDAIRMAEKFILHVEVLFATIDDLEWNFAQLGMKSALYSLFVLMDCCSYSWMQACLMFEKRACYAGRPSSSSRCSRIRKRPVSAAWA